MDEAAYRAARGAAAPQPCVFEKAMLARCATCERALRHALAEREAIGCASPTARINCATVAAQARHGSLSDLPWGEVVATVVAWQSRRRAGAAQ